MIYSEKYKVELEDIGISNKISNKRIITIMEDVAAAHSDSVGFGVKAFRIGKLVVIQLFQLTAEVGNQFILGM